MYVAATVVAVVGAVVTGYGALTIHRLHAGKVSQRNRSRVEELGKRIAFVGIAFLLIAAVMFFAEAVGLLQS